MRAAENPCRFKASVAAAADNPGQAAVDTHLLNPLRAFSGRDRERVVIVLDGFDQLHERNSPTVAAAIRILTNDDALPQVRVIVTSRTDPPPACLARRPSANPLQLVLVLGDRASGVCRCRWQGVWA